MRHYGKGMVLILAVILGAACGSREAVDDFALKAQFVVGDVTVESSGTSRTPVPGETLSEGDIIKTGAASQLDLVYGTRGFMRIQEKSVMKISELKEKTGGSTGMNLDRGKVFVMVTKLAKGSDFNVKTPLTLAAVRGTSFRVSADAKASRVDVVSGSVKVNPVREGVVMEEISAVVEKDQAVDLTEEKVREIVEKKQPVQVTAIPAGVMEEIKEEVKDIPAGVMKKLAPETSSELRRVLDIPAGGDIQQEKKADEDANLKKKEEEDQARREALAEKQRRKSLSDAKRREEEDALKREREARELSEKLAAEKAERDRLAKEAADKAKREKDAKDRSSNIPTL